MYAECSNGQLELVSFCACFCNFIDIVFYFTVLMRLKI